MAGPSLPRPVAMNTDADRRGLRRQLLTRRVEMSRAARVRAQKRAQARLTRLPCFRRARRVGIYHAVGAEIDPAGLPRLPGQQFYLPVVIGNCMRFAADDSPRVARNRFGIPEPVQSRRRPPGALDLVIVPLVGFDAACNRIGMGGGFYDRSFAYRLTRKHAGPRLVGLAFDCQQVTELPVASWDVPLDAIVTETQVHWRI